MEPTVKERLTNLETAIMESKEAIKQSSERLSKLEQITERVTGILNSITQIEMKNGTTKTVAITDLISELYNETEFMRDANKIHRMFKKYQIYKLIATAVGFALFFDVKDLVYKLITMLQ